MITLNDPTLLQQKCYVDGKWVGADDRSTVAISNPADGTALGAVPQLGTAEVKQAIASASEAWPKWRRELAKDRSRLLRRWYDLILEHQEDLALIMTAEQGKPLAEARGEVAYAASFVEWFAEEGKRVYGDTIPAPRADSRIIVIKEPIGVCGAITPWNFPSAMVTRKAAPALAVGCTVVLKPASQTPFSALALAELSRRAGLPPGVFNVVTGKASVIGPQLTAHPDIRKLTFTGSTEVGRQLMAQCAGTIKKISLELGGHAPFIIFEDADLEAAVEGAMASKYRNSGQTCVCANRFLVADSIYEAFARDLSQAAKQLRVGPGVEASSQQGPLIDGKALKKVETQIADALAKGAKVLTGGSRHPLGGTFFEPTVLGDVTQEMRISSEETFGPVAPLYRFSSEAEAIQMANNTPYGLAAYLYSRDIGRVHRVAEALEYGIVGINTGIFSNEAAPFGGIKQSGIGREGSKYGVEDYLEIKYLCLGGMDG